MHALLRRLDDAATPEVIADGERLWSELSGELPSAADASPAAGLRERLHRPIRVCGMVQNTGEPGGGPFWVRDRDGRETRQIVESAEVDMHADEQRAVFASGTHFNPVFLACGLRDHRGEAHALERFVDPDAAIVTRKSAHGHELRALERPGLWNGAMARWLTLFVEVPLTVFTPVKHVNDLLRAEHQP